jgi:hypothetical protein
MPRADAYQGSISVDIIIDFGARTIAGFPLLPVCNLDQPAIGEITETTSTGVPAYGGGLYGHWGCDVDQEFLAEMQADPLKCKPTQRMF